jgi:hypothetical protein
LTALVNLLHVRADARKPVMNRRQRWGALCAQHEAVMQLVEKHTKSTRRFYVACGNELDFIQANVQEKTT